MYQFWPFTSSASIPVSECGAWAWPIREMSVHIYPMGRRRANLLTAALSAEIWTAACSYRGTVARCRAAAAGKPLSLLSRCTLQEPPDYLTTSLLQVFALEYIRHLRRLLRLSGDSLDIGDPFDRATESSDAGAGQSAGTGRKVQSLQE